MAKARVKAPKTAAAGELVTIKTLVNHKMESGRRKDGDGNLIPRKIINAFSATFGVRKLYLQSLNLQSQQIHIFNLVLMYQPLVI